jgi:hypothetical protein
MSAHQQCSEHAEVPRELPEHAAAHLRAIGRPRIEPLQMLEVHPRSSRNIWLELAIREVPAYEQRPSAHQVEPIAVMDRSTSRSLTGSAPDTLIGTPKSTPMRIKDPVPNQTATTTKTPKTTSRSTLRAHFY